MPDLTVFPFWEHLTPDEKEILKIHTRIVSYAPNQLIGSTETDCLGLLYITKGILRLYLFSEDGREATISRLSPGEICVMTASCLFSSMTFPAQFSAEGHLEALLIPSGILSRLMLDNIYVESCFYRLATEHFSNIIRAVEQMLFSTLEQRIAAYLLNESARTDSSTLSITQEKLAKDIGSAREAVTRTLKQLNQCSCIEVFRGGIRITDRQKLQSKIAG